jgi:hypothetical protein
VVRFLAAAGNFSLLRRVQTGSAAHPSFLSIVYREIFRRDKAVGA